MFISVCLSVSITKQESLAVASIDKKKEASDKRNKHTIYILWKSTMLLGHIRPRRPHGWRVKFAICRALL